MCLLPPPQHRMPLKDISNCSIQYDDLDTPFWLDHPENEKSDPDFVPESDDDSSEVEIKEEEFRDAVVAVRETESTQDVDATEGAERVRNVRGCKISKNRKHSLIDSHPMLPSCACKRKCVDSIDGVENQYMKSIGQ